ncbi:hypothetical protein CONLIGDRAFT_248296 [Coniochaeta ligniaria NRRL 30616]|uniref:Uncharacterized protein n=1 Tax=Coniochaeta ligniaria NRRL 30616 TaxID=1408157 RepID=A0A1J7IXR6_9PEZI|nr:hypothetical protein CONLIGDRAFT_248296 [Coniochaeta ligniaria NRRL 30616]
MFAMESKKDFTTFTEASSSRAVSPSSTVFRPRSPFRSGRSSPRPASGFRLTKDLFDSDGLSEPISCVTRETFQEDCARHRFIVWAAVKRNSSVRMKPEEKLRCPLLRCNQHFPDHELMLRHLVGCEQLASGEYWCYDHMRIERFDDMKCKHCLGHPSKRRKVLSLAKNFFHSLGHKSKKGQGLESYSEDQLMPPPPSYESISLTPQSDLTELPASQIVEADSTEIRAWPSHVPDVAAINPQALLVPSVPELDCTGQPISPFIQWDQAQTMHGPDLTWNAPDATNMYNTSSRPSLQLNTFGLQGLRQLAPPKQALPAQRSKNLSPSSSLRSNTSTNSNTSTSTSLISPVSNWSGAWSLGSGFNTGLTSPVDDILTDNLFTASASGSKKVTSEFSFLHDFYSELPADVPDARGTSDTYSDPLLLSLNETSSINPPYAGDIKFDDDLDLGLGDSSLPDLDVCCSETKSMVGSACDALQAHIDESTLKIHHVARNQLAEQLRSMSSKSVATAGLRTLRALLNGNNPSSAIDALCFIHLTYAFSMVTFEQHTIELSTNLFIQSLSYANEFPPIDRSVYQQLVSLIWQPPSVGPDLRWALNRSLVAQGKMTEATVGASAQLRADSLLSVAMSFLDKLEISLVLGQPPTCREELSSDLYAKHLFDINPAIMSTPFPIAAKLSIQQLQQDHADAAGLAEKLMDVVHRVNGGMVLSVRRLEIELIQAGIDCMNALRYYGNFIPDVRRLCDQMYEHHNSGTARRIAYHDDAISLVEKLMSLSEAHKGDGATLDDAGDFDRFLDQLASRYRQPPPQQEPGPSTAIAYNDLAMDLSGTSSIKNHNLLIPKVTTTPPDNIDSRSASTPSEVQPKLEPSTQDQQQQEEAQHQKLIEAEACCEECGYRPKGDPQWFKGSMSKHRRVMHSAAPPRIYKCPFPGCASQYKNRPDNLRQHQIEKGHFVEGEEVATRRPSKRKKTAVEDE